MDYWSERLARYNSIEWVRRSDLTEHVVSKLRLGKTDRFVDLGCGTGVLCHLAAPLVGRVVGVDSSPDMVRHACSEMSDNESFVVSDIGDTPLRSEGFTRASMKMVLHHVECTVDALREARRLLSPGGLLVVCEGVPPSDDPEVVSHYAGTMALKEERFSRTSAEYARSLHLSGFEGIETEHVWLCGMSTRSWCYTSMVPPDTVRAICRRRTNAPQVVRDAYNMRVVNGDPVVDIRFAIVTGRKPA